MPSAGNSTGVRGESTPLRRPSLVATSFEEILFWLGPRLGFPHGSLQAGHSLGESGVSCPIGVTRKP